MFATRPSLSDSDVEYTHDNPNKSAEYIYPSLLRSLQSHPSQVRTIIDIGCGTGDIAHRLMNDGYHVRAVDGSSDAIRQANIKYPHLDLERRSIYDDVWSFENLYDAVIATEVIEHLYFPRRLISIASSVLKPGGVFVITTPYHGYFKYLTLAILGRMDNHLQAQRDHGHIKFFSPTTLRPLLAEASFEAVRFGTVGRLGPIAKSMVVSARKPTNAKRGPIE